VDSAWTRLLDRQPSWQLISFKPVVLAMRLELIFLVPSSYCLEVFFYCSMLSNSRVCHYWPLVQVCSFVAAMPTTMSLTHAVADTAHIHICSRPGLWH
jgi:hypothetical protein